MAVLFIVACAAVTVVSCTTVKLLAPRDEAQILMSPAPALTQPLAQLTPQSIGSIEEVTSLSGINGAVHFRRLSAGMDSSLVAVDYGYQSGLLLWDFDLGQMWRGSGASAAYPALSLDGRTLVTAAKASEGLADLSSGVQVLSAPSFGIDRVLDAQLTGISAVAVSGTTGLIADGLDSGNSLNPALRHGAVRLWRSDSDTRAWEFPTGIASPTGLAFTPDEGTLLVATSDFQVRAVSVSDGQLTGSYNPPSPALSQFGADQQGLAWVSMSGDGRFVAAAFQRIVTTNRPPDAQLAVWDASNGTVVGAFSSPPSIHQIGGLAFSPDASVFAAILDGRLSLWRTADWQPLAAPMSVETGLSGIAFAAGGQALVLGIGGSAVSVWGVPVR